ncbi:Pleckstrin homology domain-containing protein [Lipomyces oligophaga]|uniref:Pleckstrin homology domain-containing protein n=1 Tax=Lipomyces oligophaga TaxID=45792 RepID=UPI0034CE5C7F
MASAESSETEHSSPILAEDAYPFTNYRLSHGNALHLHTTSRVVLIGPIPADWLRRHQSQWLARVARLNEAEFKHAWSSIFPDLAPPPAGPGAVPTSSLAATSLPSSSIYNKLKDRADPPNEPALESSSLLSSSSKLPILTKHPTLSSFGSPGGSQARPESQPNIPGILLKPDHPNAGAISSRASSHYHDVGSTFSSAPGSSTSSPPLRPSDPVGIGSSSQFPKYSDIQYDLSQSVTRGRPASRYMSSRRSSGFAPSSYTSAQSFKTARGTSLFGSTRSHSLGDSTVSDGTRRSRSLSVESTTSTIRAAVDAAGEDTVVESSDTGSRTAPSIHQTPKNNITQIEENMTISPELLNVPRNAAKFSLSTLLQRDEEVRRIRSDSRTDNRRSTDSSRPLLGSRRSIDDHESHMSDDESIRDLEINFMPDSRTSHEHRGTEEFDIVLDGASILGAVGPELGASGPSDELPYKLQTGQVIKIEKALVAVKSANVRTLPSDYNDSETTSLDVVERAREYLAVTRYIGGAGTADGAHETKFRLELYRVMTVPAISEEKLPISLAHSIPLDRRFVNVNLFSALDKSIVLWQSSLNVKSKKKARTMVYIIRFHIPTSSMAWYGFFKSILGAKAVRDIILQVPDLGATLRIALPWEEIQRHNRQILIEAQTRERSDSINVSSGNPMKFINIIQYTIDTALEILQKVPDYRDMIQSLLEHERLGLAWHRYDRIEWLHSVTEQHMYAALALRRTHELELRVKEHYPTFAPSTTARGKSLAEPPPIEGFLIRLTQYSGSMTRLGRLFFKQFYFMCHDNLLLFCKPHHATPPAFEKPFTPESNDPSVRNFVHEFTPYPMDNGNIEWLNDLTGRSPGSLKELDEIALSEVYRRLYQLLTSAGFIDLCDVTEVRPVKRDEIIDSYIGVGEGVNFNNSARNESTNFEDGIISSFDNDRVFELVLRSGLIVRLQAFSKITRDEWIKRLDELRIYWQARMQADARAMSVLKADNVQQLHMDEEMESQMGKDTSKWEALKGIADPKMYNVCPLAFCRSIAMKGQLYFKLRKQSYFKLLYVVICHGHLILYEEQIRSTSGVEVPKIYHKKREVIPLRDCYVYAGILTEQDLMNQNNSFNVSATPGMYSLPRIYEDGTTASDDEFSRCFVLWRPKTSIELADDDSEYMFTKQFRRKQGVSSDPGDKFYSTNKLGTAGMAVMFMARSRLEKELWISVMTEEIGRIQERSISHHICR